MHYLFLLDLKNAVGIIKNQRTTETKTETVEKSDSTEKVEESTKPEVEESKNEEAKSS